MVDLARRERRFAARGAAAAPSPRSLPWAGQRRSGQPRPRDEVHTGGGCLSRPVPSFGRP